MKKRDRLGAFLSGMLAGAMLLGCGTVALAAGGGVTFGTTGLKTIGGKTVVEPGDTVTNATGCEIPATILYTDEKGGGNTYVHIGTVAQALEIPIDWENSMIYLGGKSLSNVAIDAPMPDWSELKLNNAGAKAAHYTEVEPYWPTEEEIMGSYGIESRRISDGAGGSFGPVAKQEDEEGYLSLNGEYLSLSVTNNTQHDMLLAMRCPRLFYLLNDVFGTTLVPAGETVVRTFQAGEYTGYLSPREIWYNVYFLDHDVGRTEMVDITVSAVSFSRQP